MTYLIPFLTFPLLNTYNAYKSTTIEFPSLDSLNNEIKAQLDPFLKNAGLRNDLIIHEVAKRGIIAFAQGTNLFTSGAAIITVAMGLNNLDKEAFHWILKHEIGHIKNNDSFKTPLIGSICSTATAIFGALTRRHWLLTTLLTISVGFAVFITVSQWAERKADEFAIKYSSTEELLGARRLFISQISTNIALREIYPAEGTYSSSGECRFAISHPSLSSRLSRIENALVERSHEYDTTTEDYKIYTLITYSLEPHTQTRYLYNSNLKTLFSIPPSNSC
jgi:Zn-dependent protease with chaperone function